MYDDIKKIKEAFKGFAYIGLKKTIDEYYYDPLRDNLKPDKKVGLNHCLRLRQKMMNIQLICKDDVFENGKWLYSNEYETKVELLSITKQIFKKLGLIKFIEIDNGKETYTFKDYEIVIENVKDLGLFLEVEYCTDIDGDVKMEKKNSIIY